MNKGYQSLFKEGKDLNKKSSVERSARTIEEINEKIRNGDVQVLSVSEMKELVESSGVQVAFKDVDVITTGTFGAMCSSGAVINIGHADPPIKIEKAWINDVPVSHPGAAVDLYIGATQMSETQPFEYGGGHVIEDLIKGKEVELRATAYGTDCYPRTKLEVTLTKDDLNQFQMLNFRNGYQRYACATNGRDETIYTYMGKLLPKYRNSTYSGSGELNPLSNDPDYETIGLGTRIFLNGGVGYVIGEGTQHSPGNGFGTIMVKGDAKAMDPKFIRGATFTNYGTTLYNGIGIPIPILNEGIVHKVAVRDEDIYTNIVDYGVPRRDRPTLGTVNYKTLKSGRVTIDDRSVKVSSVSSLKKAYAISETLKEWIAEGRFYLTAPIERLPTDSVANPMRKPKGLAFVEDVVHDAVTCTEDEEIEEVARRLINRNINHLVVVDAEGKLSGIVTSWDVTKSIANGKGALSDFIVKDVHSASLNEPLETALRRMTEHNISALPVTDGEGRVTGIVTSEDISKLLGGGRFG
ncbi:homocysteine biosynthesis protein [Candidatus Bathyarchaeota archaeon]|nr:homocysteine biosynthesis protein [Candidatus Bathyarchaeota archaeon]